MVTTRQHLPLSDGYLQLKPVSQGENHTVFERFCQHHLPAFEITAALNNEHHILKHLDGCGAPQLQEDTCYPADSQSLFFRTTPNLSLCEMNPLQFTLHQRLQIATSMARALCQVHAKGVLHLALRPATFLLSDDFEQAVLVDFSSARLYPKEVSGLSSFRPVMADPHFLAPEQGNRFPQPLDRRTDVYALGCVLNWLFSGQIPFHWLLDDSAISYAQIAQPMPVDIQPKGAEIIDSRVAVTKTALMAILGALLEKDPANRYQSCSGLLADLEALQGYVPEQGDFVIRQQDRSDRLYIPQRLYGREAESKALLDAFQRVSTGPSEALLISGYSGVGKSALVNEVQAPILKADGLFVVGKFDQYRSSTPYSAIEQAFSHFIRNLLALPEEDVSRWRKRLNKVLAPNAQILIDILPDLGSLLGPQLQPARLGSEEQQHRFNRVFLQFVREVCTAHKPLVVFIDDLQWADLASINLLRLLLTDAESQYFLLLGAYRDNEVDIRHPFARMLQELKRENLRLTQVDLLPLPAQAVHEVIRDTLELPLEQVCLLGDLIHRKTDGNPFFLRQFLYELYQAELLSFHYRQNRWCWSVSAIEQQGSTDNVIELMIAKIGRLPAQTQYVLKQASCIGAEFSVERLMALNADVPALDQVLAPALQAGLLLPGCEVMTGGLQQQGTLRFLHDRVQQAAYSLLDENERTDLHYRIGSVLLEQTRVASTDTTEQHCFELVSHFNLALGLLSAAQREHVMVLNLQAAKKAKSATAYDTAVEYLNHFFTLSLSSSTVAERTLFDAGLERLECLYLAGEFDGAERLQTALAAGCKDIDERVRFHTVLITQYTRFGKLDQAITHALNALAELGYPMPVAPAMDDVGRMITDVQQLLTATPFDQLCDKPDVMDPKVLHQLEILMAMQPCCYNSGSLLFPLTILGLLRLTLTEGNSPHSSYIYMMYGLMCTKVLKDYDTAFEAATFSGLIAKRYPASPLIEGRLQMMLSNFVLPWQQPLIRSSEMREAAYHRCLEQGDYYWGVHAYIFGFYADLMVSTCIDTLLQRMEQVSVTCEKIKQPAQVYLSTLQCNLLKILSGELDNQHSLDHIPGYEAKAQAHYIDTHYMCGRYDRLLGRLMQGYLFGNYEEALNVSLSESLTSADLDEGIFHEAVYTQFNLLAVLALRQTRGEIVRKSWQDWFDQYWPVLQRWYALNPDNFAPCYYLVTAELAVIDGREADALGAFEHALIYARDGGFALWQALANERMGKYRLSKLQRTLGKAYLEESVRLYQSWGAGAKAAELERFIRALNPEQIITAGHSDDWQLMTAATQEISRLLDLQELERRMLAWSTKATGAQWAALYNCHDGDWQLSNLQKVGALVEPEGCLDRLPLAMLNYCRNSQTSLMLEDAAHEGDFILDPYVTTTGCRSVLLIPLYHHDRLLSVLHLEHRDTRNLFSAQRLRVLELLSSQFASSYHNSLLYGQLQVQNEVLEQIVSSRTSELRQKSDHLEAILDALPIPYVMSREDGSIIDCNELFTSYFGIGKETLADMSVSQLYSDPMDRTRMLAQLAEQGVVSGFECQLKTLQGEVLWGLFSATFIDVNGERRIFAAVSDISERKALERKLHQQANTDPLTGVCNRRALLALGNRLHNVSGDRPLCVAMIDLDHFKHLNDTYGHVAGDQVLKDFTAAVQHELRENDLFGRVGGEEFALILPELPLELAFRVLERIRQMTEQRVIVFEQSEIRLTMSAGLTQWHKHETMSDVLGRADLSLYDAKQFGRNQVKAD